MSLPRENNPDAPRRPRRPERAGDRPRAHAPPSPPEATDTAASALRERAAAESARTDARCGTRPDTRPDAPPDAVERELVEARAWAEAALARCAQLEAALRDVVVWFESPVDVAANDDADVARAALGLNRLIDHAVELVGTPRVVLADGLAPTAPTPRVRTADAPRPVDEAHPERD